MSVRLYMDVHVRRAVTAGLRLRGVDILTAQEDGTGELPDTALLDRATELGRVLFTQDDLLREAKRWQQTSKSFAVIIYTHQLGITVSQCIADLGLIAQASEPHEWLNRTVYLPLK